MSSDLIEIKGVQEGLLISLSPTEEWNHITRELASRIDERIDFFSGARITVDLGERPVPKYELSSLKALVERRGLSLMVVQSSSQTTIDSALALDLRTMVPQIERQADVDADALSIDPEEHGTVGVMIRRTLRSGRTVHSRGHVVVYGDVNPGAQIIATGDIIVWGKLRGMVHAGAEGDTEALVCALDMQPNQLRIAGHMVTSSAKGRRRTQPEVAQVRGNQIIVEAWG